MVPSDNGPVGRNHPLEGRRQGRMCPKHLLDGPIQVSTGFNVFEFDGFTGVRDSFLKCGSQLFLNLRKASELVTGISDSAGSGVSTCEPICSYIQRPVFISKGNLGNPHDLHDLRY